MEVDPGTYNIEARRGELVLYTRAVSADVGKTIEVFIDAGAEPAAPTEKPRARVDARPLVVSESSRSLLPYLAIGSGVAFAGLSVWSYSRASATDSALHESCVTYCDDSLRETRGQWNVLTATSAAIAATALVTGVVLFIVAPTAKANSVAIGFGARFNGGTVSLSGSF